MILPVRRAGFIEKQYYFCLNSTYYCSEWNKGGDTQNWDTLQSVNELEVSQNSGLSQGRKEPCPEECKGHLAFPRVPLGWPS